MLNLLRPGGLMVRQFAHHVPLPAVRRTRRLRTEQLLLRALRTPSEAEKITVYNWTLQKVTDPERDIFLVYLYLFFILFEKRVVIT